MSERFYTDDGREVSFRAMAALDREWLETGVERVRVKTGAKFSAQEVADAVADGRLWAFAVEVAGARMGGIVVAISEYVFPTRMVFSVLAIFGDEVASWIRPALAAANAAARQTGCDVVRLESPRRGWLKMIPRDATGWVIEQEVRA